MQFAVHLVLIDAINKYVTQMKCVTQMLTGLSPLFSVSVNKRFGLGRNFTCWSADREGSLNPFGYYFATLYFRAVCRYQNKLTTIYASKQLNLLRAFELPNY